MRRKILILATLALMVSPLLATEPPQCTLPNYGQPTRKMLGGHWTYRQPKGHTHSCSNGHTWDHQANSSHRCQYCGQSQYVQDSRPRMVTVWNPPTTSTASTSRSLAPTEWTLSVPIVPRPTPQSTLPQRVVTTTPARVQYSPIFKTLQGSGCANGNCPLVR